MLNISTYRVRNHINTASTNYRSLFVYYLARSVLDKVASVATICVWEFD